MKNRTRPFFGRATLIGCAAALVLALSAIPVLTLWLNDARLLAQPHERTRQTGVLALTSDDVYLTRIPKKYSQRHQLQGYQAAPTYLDGMSYASPNVLAGCLDALCEAGALPAEWRDYCASFLGDTVFSSEDSLGFVHYVAYNADAYAEDYACYIVGVTVERESQKVIALWASAPWELNLPQPETTPTLEAYRAYLGLEGFGEWADPANTRFEGVGLYSPRAELMLFYETGVYWANDYGSYRQFGGTPLNRSFERSYFCLNALSVSAKTVSEWQAYARSFPEGTPLWGRSEEDNTSKTEEHAFEEALG